MTALDWFCAWIIAVAVILAFFAGADDDDDDNHDPWSPA